MEKLNAAARCLPETEIVSGDVQLMPVPDDRGLRRLARGLVTTRWSVAHVAPPRAVMSRRRGRRRNLVDRFVNIRDISDSGGVLNVEASPSIVLSTMAWRWSIPPLALALALSSPLELSAESLPLAAHKYIDRHCRRGIHPAHALLSGFQFNNPRLAHHLVSQGRTLHTFSTVSLDAGRQSPFG
jgi:hypothetical protein